MGTAGAGCSVTQGNARMRRHTMGANYPGTSSGDNAIGTKRPGRGTKRPE